MMGVSTWFYMLHGTMMGSASESRAFVCVDGIKRL